MEITVLILLLLALSFVLYFLINKLFTKKAIKPQGVKKEEIIKAYETQMKELLKKYENDKELLLIKKKAFIKKVNSELTMNLFFDEDESRAIIQKLLRL